MKKWMKVVIMTVFAIELFLSNTLVTIAGTYEIMTNDKQQIKKLAEDMGLKEYKYADKNILQKKLKKKKRNSQALLIKKKKIN